MGTKFEEYYNVNKMIEFADFRAKVINCKELSDKVILYIIFNIFLV